LKSIISPIVALLLCFGSAQAESEFIRLNAAGKSLNVERGVLELSGIKPRMQSAMWEKVSAGNGLFFLRNRQTGQYLVSSGSSVTTTDQAPSPQGAGPHYWRYTQPFSNEPLVSALTTQSGLYLNESSSALTLEKSPSSATLRIAEVGPASQPTAPPVAVQYQRLINTKQDPLHIEQGPPVFSRMDPGSPGCMWEVKESSNRGLFMIFINRSTGQVLSSSGATLTTQASEPIKTGQEPFYWKAVRNGEFLELTNSQGARIDKVLLQPVR
jgi:hypothetical protein